MNSALGTPIGIERRSRPENPMGNAGDVNAGETICVTAGETAQGFPHFKKVLPNDQRTK